MLGETYVSGPEMYNSYVSPKMNSAGFAVGIGQGAKYGVFWVLKMLYLRKLPVKGGCFGRVNAPYDTLY